MWVFNKDGFFSVVFDRDCNRDELMVRARCREDLVRLAKKMKGYLNDKDIVEFDISDYKYRMKVDKNLWADYLRQSALDIDYSNVKASIIPLADKPRQTAYYDIWTALYRWQSSV